MRVQALSRAFRSRFLELHVGEIPDAELANILQERCALAPSYAAKLVAVMRELQRRRQVGSSASVSSSAVNALAHQCAAMGHAQHIQALMTMDHMTMRRPSSS